LIDPFAILLPTAINPLHVLIINKVFHLVYAAGSETASSAIADKVLRHPKLLSPLFACLIESDIINSQFFALLNRSNHSKDKATSFIQKHHIRIARVIENGTQGE